jgi:hypothetical protein
LGLAVLKPEVPLVPLAFAQFGQDAAELGSAVTIAGFSFEDVLTRPVLSFGRIEDLTGLNGEADRIRLSATVRQGDVGGAVFGPNGAVVGLLTGQPDDPTRQLPPEVLQERHRDPRAGYALNPITTARSTFELPRRCNERAHRVDPDVIRSVKNGGESGKPYETLLGNESESRFRVQVDGIVRVPRGRLRVAQEQIGALPEKNNGRRR